MTKALSLRTYCEHSVRQVFYPDSLTYLWTESQKKVQRYLFSFLLLSYNADMKDQALREMMSLLIRESKELSPKLRAQYKQFCDLLVLSNERNPRGGLTDKARQALQKLRNPLLNSTHHNKARTVAALAVQETGKELAVQVEKAFKAFALYSQAKIELDLFPDDMVAPAPSRQNKSPGAKPDVERFLANMQKRGLPDYKLGRLPEYRLDLIAGLIDDDESWKLLFSAGVLDAFSGSMTPDEATALTVAKQVAVDDRVLEFKSRLEASLRRPLDITPAFAAVCLAISEGLWDFSMKDKEALRYAGQEVEGFEVETLIGVLGLEETEREKVAAFVSFIHQSAYLFRGSENEIRMRVVLDQLEKSIGSYEQRDITPARWLEKIRADLLVAEGTVAKALSDESAFYILLMIALEGSRSFTKLESTLVAEGRRRIKRESDELIQSWLQQGMDCYTDADGNAHLGCPEEDSPGVTYYPIETEPEAWRIALEQTRRKERQYYREMDYQLAATADRDDGYADDEIEGSAFGTPGRSSSSEDHQPRARASFDIIDAEFVHCELDVAAKPKFSVGTNWSDEQVKGKSSTASRSRFEEFE